MEVELSRFVNYQIFLPVECMQRRLALGQYAIALLLGFKDAFDEVKRMLNLRYQIGLEHLELIAQPCCPRLEQRTALTWAQSNLSEKHAKN